MRISPRPCPIPNRPRRWWPRPNMNWFPLTRQLAPQDLRYRCRPVAWRRYPD